MFLYSRAFFDIIFTLAAPALASYRARYGKPGIENEVIRVRPLLSRHLLRVRPLLSRHLHPPARRERLIVANVRRGRLAAAVPFAARRLRQSDVGTVDESGRFPIAQSTNVNICRESSMDGHGHEQWFFAAPKRLARYGFFVRFDHRRSTAMIARKQYREAAYIQRYNR